MTVTYQKLQNPNTFVGIDVDKKSYSFTVTDNNTMKRSKKIPSNPEQLYNYINKTYPGKSVLYAYEAGPTGYGLFDYITSKGATCFVVSPNTIPKASNDKVKNNRIDSASISEKLSNNQLESIRVPLGNYRELRNLVKTRENYSDARKVAKQRIKSLLLYANLYEFIKEPESNWTNRFTQCLKEIPCTEAVRSRLDMLLMDLDYNRKQLLSSHKILRSFISNNSDIQKNMEYATSIPGIGFITAVTFLAKSGNPAKLKNPRELGAFIGLTPSEHSTGDTESRGPITHLGDKKLRKLFIEAAWVSIRKDTQLRLFFQRIVSKNHPKGAKQKAITAVARKLTERLYRVFKDQRKYFVH